MKYYSNKYLQQLYKNIFLNKTVPKKRKLKILIGPPASGKGTLMNKYKLLNKYTVMINYDDIIHNNPAYIKEKNKIKDKNELQKLYFKYRSEVYDIDNIMHEKIIKKGCSILWETTGVNIDYMYNWFYELKKKNYDIEVHILCIDKKLLYNRLLERARKIGQEPAPRKQIENEYYQSYKNISHILPYINKLTLYDNSDTLQKILIIESYYKVQCLCKISDSTISLLKNILPDDIMRGIQYSNSCITKSKYITRPRIFYVKR